MFQVDKKEKIIELSTIKKNLLNSYIFMLLISVVLCFLVVYLSKWFIILLVITIVLCLRQLIHLQNVNCDLDSLKRSK
jgi:hypothetical protein